ncbi:hypothetical protein Purlil1_7615 [Purpureocillium lilacinum]|uniref:Secreted protein n=1 Tax=Purpureocillium lilacinum TaxID=33203 RepID=A0ABR0BVR6_PURLI|nr:hypothetical protein Purlil1_7615 [Purpureocillium lilacinum]
MIRFVVLVLVIVIVGWRSDLTVEKQQPGTYLYECGAKDKDMFPPVSAAEPIQLLMRWAAKFCHEEHGHTVTAAQECIETYDKCTEPLKGEDQFADDFEEKTREVVNKCLKDTGNNEKEVEDAFADMRGRRVPQIRILKPVSETTSPLLLWASYRPSPLPSRDWVLHGRAMF